MERLDLRVVGLYAKDLRRIGGIVKVELSKPDDVYYIDGRGTENVAYESESSADGLRKHDIVIQLTTQHFMEIMDGRANPIQLFMDGKLKFKGNMGLLMKLR